MKSFKVKAKSKGKVEDYYQIFNLTLTWLGLLVQFWKIKSRGPKLEKRLTLIFLFINLKQTTDLSCSSLLWFLFYIFFIFLSFFVLYLCNVQLIFWKYNECLFSLYNFHCTYFYVYEWTLPCMKKTNSSQRYVGPITGSYNKGILQLESELYYLISLIIIFPQSCSSIVMATNRSSRF